MDLNHRPPGPEPRIINPIYALADVAYGIKIVFFPLILYPSCTHVSERRRMHGRKDAQPDLSIAGRRGLLIKAVTEK